MFLRDDLNPVTAQTFQMFYRHLVFHMRNDFLLLGPCGGQSVDLNGSDFQTILSSALHETRMRALEQSFHMIF
jgi:hypothetical protein